MLKFNDSSKGKEALNIEESPSVKTKKNVKKKLNVSAQTKRRPLYETESDLKNESDIAENISQTFKVALDKMPISYGLDFFVTKKNKAIGVMEVKRRKMNHNKHETFMISLLKWNKGLDFYYKNKLRFSIAIMFDDGLYRYVFKEDDLNKIFYEYGGRTVATRDEADCEPVIHIPMTLWQKVPLIPST